MLLLAHTPHATAWVRPGLPGSSTGEIETSDAGTDCHLMAARPYRHASPELCSLARDFERDEVAATCRVLG